MVKVTTINANEFASRADLETKVAGTYGATADLKPDVEIRGTREEMGRLGLSGRTLLWGVKCVITDEPTETRKQADVERPVRGDIKDFGMNGAVSKPPKDIKADA